MDIEVQYFDDCPNWSEFVDAVERVLEEAGRDDDVRLVRVESPEDAARIGFTGSPTLRVDGTDPFAGALDVVGMACRAYFFEGKLVSRPPDDALRLALGIQG